MSEIVAARFIELRPNGWDGKLVSKPWTNKDWDRHNRIILTAQRLAAEAFAEAWRYREGAVMGFNVPTIRVRELENHGHWHARRARVLMGVE